jgi:hypothetical protein
MTTGSAEVPTELAAGTSQERGGSRLRAYFFSDSTRTAQTVLGLFWLLDGGLQFQSFMYSKDFVQTIHAMASGQPHWLGSSVNWGANTAAQNLGLYNSLFALIQIVIGLGLLYRPTVKPALVVSFAWSVFVWWFGEAFGMLFANSAQPLTGAPGAVILYAIVGLVVWPNGRPGGLLGVLGTRIMWASLWLVSAYLWLLEASSAPNAIHDAINAAPSGMSWLSSLQNGFASVTQGNGLIFALMLAAASTAIALGVAFNRGARQLIALSVVLQLIYWLVGQGLGGIVQADPPATDPNAAPLFILLAYCLDQLCGYRLSISTIAEQARP